MRKRTRRLLVIGAGVLVLGIAFTIAFASFSPKSGENEARFLTTTDAELVAIARFQNFSLGTREVSLTFLTNEGNVTVEGHYDYRSGAGGAKLSLEDRGGLEQMVWWTPHTVGVLREALPTDATVGEVLGGEVSPDGWDFMPMDQAMQTQLGQSLFLISSLGTDRPENPKLLEQSDAVWLSEGKPEDSLGWSSELLQPSINDQEQMRGHGEAPFIWVQLPSNDEVRSEEATAEVFVQRPRLLVDADGKIWRVEFAHRQSGTVAVVRFGDSNELSLSTPEFETGL